jgi:hypothetical protein
MRLRTSVALAAVLLVTAATPALPDGQKSGSISGMEVVGQTDLAGRGFNADVWAHDGFAYVGQWGFIDFNDGGEQRFCPAGAESGVKVVDVREPADPQMVATLQNPPGTSAEDVVVYTAENGPLAGRDIAVAGIQVCGGSRYDTSFLRGLMLWDVSDATNPQQLGFVDSGCCTRGVHELEVMARTDLGRTFAYASVPASEYSDTLSPTGRRDQQGRGDFRLFDITDPAHPFEASDWGVLADLGAPTQPALGCDPDNIFGHSAEPSADGRLVFVAYWDSGFIALDVSDPANPVFLGNTTYPSNADGDGHSSNYDEERGLLFTGDEDFCKTSGPATEKGFGYLRVYDYRDLTAPVQIGEYRTPNSGGTADRAAGDYTIHNPFLVGETLYVSWYSDGVRVLDVSDAAHPTEVAHFVPPAAKNPVQPSQRGVLTNTAQVWGVDVQDGLVFASDMNSGLWILRRT